MLDVSVSAPPARKVAGLANSPRRKPASSNSLNLAMASACLSGGANYADLPPVRARASLSFGRNRSDPLEHEAERIADQVVRADRQPTIVAPKIGTACSLPGRSMDEAPSLVRQVLHSAGQPLDAPTLAFFEPRFSRDFSKVRVHTDERAARSARAINAAAYTAGQSIVFGRGAFAPESHAGRHLLAHELAHVVQQSSGVHQSGDADKSIQRFEAGEHAQFGETGNELKALINAPAQIYVVKPGDTPASIASAFSVPLGDLLERNKAKIKPVKQKVRGAKNKVIDGFPAGVSIEIPQVLNQAMQDALTVDELSYDAGQPEAAGPDAGKRTRLKYGEGIAMSGDLFGDPGQIDATPKAKLDVLQTMIKDEKTTAKAGKFIDSSRWEAATDGRFTDLASKNEPHFAPSDPALAATSGTSKADHKSSWEQYHASALSKSQAGDRDQALQVNAFADHFLTDAFSAGHLINKADVAAKFAGGIATNVPDPKKPGEREVAKSSEGFFDRIAQLSFTGPVAAEFSQYEMVGTKYWIHWSINSVGKFSSLLQSVYVHPVGGPYVLGSVVKVVHDELSTKAGGISVENQKGDKWQLPGDKTLNASTIDPKDAAKTLEVGHKAVSQSQYNVLSVFQLAGPLNLPPLFKAVWDYVPRPTTAGAAAIKAIVDTDTDPNQAPLVAKLADLVKTEYKTILAKLIALKQLRKA